MGLAASALLVALCLAAFLTQTDFPQRISPSSGDADTPAAPTNAAKLPAPQSTAQEPDLVNWTVPSPPRESAPPRPPRFVQSGTIRMSAQERQARRLLLGSPGPAAEYRSSNPEEMPEASRVVAQRQMLLKRKELLAHPEFERVQRLTRATRDYKLQLWAQGSTDLARWVFEREVDLDASMSDGLPAPTTVSSIACPLVEAALLCEQLSYARCEAADGLRLLAEAACIN